MPFVLGIDEAGYGPLLGPLVVGATLWRVKPEALERDFWKPLADCVARRADRAGVHLPVGDSKQIYDRKKGITTLERSVLAFARAAGVPPDSLAELLDALGARADSAARQFPWYRDLRIGLPLDPARSACTGVAEKLGRTMDAAGIRCCGMRVELLTEDVFNERVARTHNKAAVLLESVLRLIHWAGAQSGDSDLHVFVDRLGGRSDYRKLLMDAFPDRHLHVIEAREERSRYRLASTRNDWHLAFCVDGDQIHMPIALASMLAKYVREALMMRFNAYWHSLDADLRPTAGYYRDARRFLSDIEPLRNRSGLKSERFVRQR